MISKHRNSTVSALWSSKRLSKAVFFALIFPLGVTCIEVQAQSSLDKVNVFLPSIPLEIQLINAVKRDDALFVQALFNQGLSPTVAEKTPPHYSLLHLAAWEGAENALRVILQHSNAEVDILNNLNETPLMIASLKGQAGITRQLLAAGAYPNKSGWTPLHYAATSGNVELIRTLLEAHAYIDAESPNKTTPLMMAVRSKNILAVKLLLDEGADVNLQNEQGLSALDFADRFEAKDIADGLRARAKKLSERETKPAWLR